MCRPHSGYLADGGCESTKLGSAWKLYTYSTSPKGPYTAHSKTLVPNTIPAIGFGTRVFKWAVYGPFGIKVLYSTAKLEVPSILADSRDQKVSVNILNTYTRRYIYIYTYRNTCVYIYMVHLHADMYIHIYIYISVCIHM